MKLTTNELTLFRNYLLSKRAYRNTAIPLQPRIWEEWMDGTPTSSPTAHPLKGTKYDPTIIMALSSRGISSLPKSWTSSVATLSNTLYGQGRRTGNPF